MSSILIENVEKEEQATIGEEQEEEAAEEGGVPVCGATFHLL
jgi:hypothetical protein